MSNRLTFSLASLVLILMFAFVAMPVMAHEVVDDPEHQHPEITVTIADGMDADPNTSGFDVVDSEADAPDYSEASSPTIQFDVTLTLPMGAPAPATDPFARVTGIAYDDDGFAAGTGAGGAVDIATWAPVPAGAASRVWTSTVTITLEEVPDPVGATSTADTREAAHAAAIAAAIAAGINVDITVPAGIATASLIVSGPMAGQANLESKTTVTVIAGEVELTVDPLEFDFTGFVISPDGGSLGIPDATVGEAYSFTLPAAKVGTGTAPYTYSLNVRTDTEEGEEEVSSANGLTLTDGVLSGTPSSVSWGPPLIWRVTDASDPMQEQEISLFIAVAPGEPVPIKVTGTPSLTQEFLVTFTAPENQRTRLHGSDVEVSGGDLINFWSLSSTSWRGIVRPASGTQSVSITVSDDPNNPWVKPADENGILSSEPVVAEPDDDADMLADKGYLVIVRDEDNLPDFGASSPTVMEWADMPNLHQLFIQNGLGGGSLQLMAEKADGTDVGARKVVFSEIMWAIDEGKVGQTGVDAHQWIEIYNRSGAAIPVSGISFATKEGRPALAQGTDLVSNVVSGGDPWIRTKGQSGDSGTTVNGVTTGQKEFISMYRKRFHNDSAGWNGGEWLQSEHLFAQNFRGSPGANEPADTPVISATEANRGPVIFNEISNHDNPDYEWIELRNVTDGEVNLKNWEITILTSKGSNQSGHNAVEFIQFPDADRKVPAGGILLVVATDPRSDDDHPIQTGWDITKGAGDQINGVNADSPRYIVLDFKKAKNADGTDMTESGMPDGGEFVLVLRNRKDRTASNGDNNTRDVAGFVTGAALKVDDANLFTGLWPLANFPQPNWSKNNLIAGEVHRRQFADIDGTKSKDKDQDNKTAFRNVGWTGIGYKRNAEANNQNGGTPGYPNNALQSNETQAGADPVVITEVMYATGSRANIPQWIELYNTSKTVGVNLNGWRVTIVNHDQDAGGETFAGDLSKNYAIDGKIPPGQTFLLAAYPGRDDTNLPDERIEFLRANRGELILSQYGFEITLLTRGKDGKDENRKVADMVGNLATVADARVRNNPQSYTDPAWALPMGANDDGDRISIVRVSMADGSPIDGQTQSAWKRYDMSAQFVSTLDGTSYGHSTDIGSPGHTVGGVLPVSLSKFRPERMKDTGAVVIRWVTESETNNAGFNILRSEARAGEFTKLNTKLIAGQGTTSERTTYSFPDTSAKPNVVYYYQIQDVSLEGQVNTLAITHLRGNVTAAGKLTTTWGELKALQ